MRSEDIQDVALIGSGTMGAGMGMCYAQAGYNVVLYDIKAEQLEWAQSRIVKSQQVFIDEDLLSEEAAEAARARISTTTDLGEALHLEAEGVVSVEDVDRTLKNGVGFRFSWLGPLETVDLGGLNLFHSVCQYLLPELSTMQTTPEFFDRLAEEGNWGINAGQGFYKYEADDRDEILRKRDLYFIRQLELIRSIQDK